MLHDNTFARIDSEIPTLLHWATRPDRVLAEHDPKTETENTAGPASRPTQRQLNQLISLYRKSERAARDDNRPKLRIRALFAEATVSQLILNTPPIEPYYYIAMTHRLMGNSFIAEVILHRILSTPNIEQLYAARIHRELSAISELNGDYETALAHIEMSIKYCNIDSNDRAHIKAATQSLLQKSVTLRFQGKYEDSANAIKSAQTISAELHDEWLEALTLQRLAGLKLATGYVEEASKLYHRAAQLFQHTSKNNYTYSLIRSASCLRILGNNDEARRRLSTLLEQCSNNPHRHLQISLELAEIALEDGMPLHATELLDNARGLLSDKPSIETLRFHTLAGRIMALSNDPADLHRASLIALSVIKAAWHPCRHDLYRTLMALNLFVDTLTRNASIKTQYKTFCTLTCIYGAELMRRGMRDETNRWKIRHVIDDIYNGAAAYFLESGQFANLAKLIELGKSDSIDETIRSAERRFLGYRSYETNYTVEQSTFSEAIEYIVTGDQEQSNASIPVIDPFGETIASTDMLALSIALLEKEGSLSAIRTLSTPSGAVYASHVTASPAVASLIKRTMTSTSPSFHGVRTRTWQEVGEFLFPAELTSFSQMDLLLLPDRRLWQLPWNALPFCDTHLLDRFSISLSPSFSTHSLIYRRQFRKTGKECTISIQLDSSLPGSDLEHAALERWRSASTRPFTLHYQSGHLSPADVKDLISEMRLSANDNPAPQVVVLNGCWTGTTDLQEDSDPWSLAVMHLVRGAHYVVASCGFISSAASAQVGALFLDNLRSGMTPSRSLQEAQVHFRFIHPECDITEWGGLFLVN